MSRARIKAARQEKEPAGQGGAPVTSGLKPDQAARARIDKWLWAARFFKTRSLAAQAVDNGRVRVQEAVVKPSRDVRTGDRVDIDIDGTRWTVSVKGISETRGPAPVARLLYEESAESIAAREAERARRHLFPEPAAGLHGRPTKRERRTIDRAGGQFDPD